jgi:hypothetical protein
MKEWVGVKTFGRDEQEKQHIRHLLRSLRKTTRLFCEARTDWKTRMETEVDYIEK